MPPPSSSSSSSVGANARHRVGRPAAAARRWWRAAAAAVQQGSSSGGWQCMGGQVAVRGGVWEWLGPTPLGGHPAVTSEVHALKRLGGLAEALRWWEQQVAAPLDGMPASLFCLMVADLRSARQGATNIVVRFHQCARLFWSLTPCSADSQFYSDTACDRVLACLHACSSDFWFPPPLSTHPLVANLPCSVWGTPRLVSCALVCASPHTTHSFSGPAL